MYSKMNYEERKKAIAGKLTNEEKTKIKNRNVPISKQQLTIARRTYKRHVEYLKNEYNVEVERLEKKPDYIDFTNK